MLVSTMAAAENPQSDRNDNQLDPEIYKSNVSQSENLFKHRLFFENMRRGELKRLRLSGESIKNVPQQRIYTFKALDDKLEKQQGSSIQTFRYNVHIPSNPNSILTIDQAELYLRIIPKSCGKEDQQVTLRVGENEKKVHVDACYPRWESLKVNPKELQQIQLECPDCDSKGVKLSRPALNVITNSVKRTRYRRIDEKLRQPCRLTKFVISFKTLPGYEQITSPESVDIGRCRGTCIEKPHYFYSQHTMFRNELAKANLDRWPCCAPSKYKSLNYLRKAGRRLTHHTWRDAIAIECKCF